MPDDEQEPQRGGTFSPFGIASAALGVVALVAVVLAAVTGFQKLRGNKAAH